MRKVMTKEITMTKIKIARIGVSPEGQPTTEVLPEIQFLGNITLEKSQKRVTKSYGQLTTIFDHQVYTQVYEIDVAEFIQHAKLKSEKLVTDETPEEDESDDGKNDEIPYDVSSMYPSIMKEDENSNATE